MAASWLNHFETNKADRRPRRLAASCASCGVTTPSLGFIKDGVRYQFNSEHLLSHTFQSHHTTGHQFTTMLQARLLRTCYQASHPSQLAYRTYSSPSHKSSSSENPDYEAARQWFQTFNPRKPQASESALPSTKIAKTEYSMASGPGGQKTNKYSSPPLPICFPLIYSHILS